ncbi:hypothetical protein HPB47_027373 [Ixodes persulcatus]|uniref:Uncharacterized protein n=1 Tax=Ixodes persulcatus TaxID=34615 RepID=A0AC60PW11_IXOPE|nr:hypothetical protein HPB47_027373 [Ixodes persulcatus]
MSTVLSQKIQDSRKALRHLGFGFLIFLSPHRRKKKKCFEQVGWGLFLGFPETTPKCPPEAPSLAASQRAATDQYSETSQLVNSQISTYRTPRSHSSVTWSSMTMKKAGIPKEHATHSPKVTEGLIVIFVSTVEHQLIATLSSLKLSIALEQMCPECILEVRPNKRLNLIAVDTHNGQTTRTLLVCFELCGMKVRAYEPVPRHYAIGVITDVDTALSEVQIERKFLYSRNAPYSAESVACMDIEKRLASDLLFVAAAETYMRATPSVRRKKSVSTVDNLTLPLLQPARNGRKKARLATTRVNVPLIFVLQGQLSNSLRQPTQLKVVSPLQAHRKEGMNPSRSVMSALRIMLQQLSKKAKRRREHLN